MFNDRLVKRKWGWYWTILDRKHFKVKLLRFWKGRSCSMQYHNFRSELWLFLAGSGAMARIDHPHSSKKRQSDLDLRIKSGSFYHTPIGKYHQYFAHTPTTVLEIQYGERCDESDIVRV